MFHQHARDFQSFSDVEEAVFDRAGYSEKVYKNGVLMHVLDERIFSVSGFSWVRFIQRVIALRGLINERGFSAIVGHTDGANIMVCFLPSKVKKYLVVHGTGRNKSISTLTDRIREYAIQYLYGRADRVICVSNELKKETEEVYKLKNVIAIRNYFDEDLASNNEDDPRLKFIFDQIPSSRFIVVSHGRYADGKNLELLVEIVARLKTSGVNVTLLLVGDGPEHRRLSEKSEALKLSVLDMIKHPDNSISRQDKEPDVVFTGFVSNPIDYLRRSDLFAMPSKWEGYPLALCEALLCNLPVLVADCPTGPREILGRLAGELTSNSGLLPIPTDDESVEEWFVSLRELVQNSGAYAKAKTRSMALAALIRLDKKDALMKWSCLINS